MGGGSALNAFEADESTIIGNRRQQGGRGAIDHFGIGVANRAELDATRDRLVAAGAEIGEIQLIDPTIWSLFFRDCDGMELEVNCPTDAAATTA